jgi:hypothetical protein
MTIPPAPIAPLAAHAPLDAEIVGRSQPYEDMV